MIQLPRLLDKQMQEVARLHPVSLSLDLNMAPLSTATMTLPEGQPEMQTGAFVELFTLYGSAGIFRVQQANQQFGGIMTLNLEHGIVTLADAIIPGTLEEEKTTSARAALAEIIGYQDVWRLGKVEVPENTMLSWSYDYSNLLESFLSILDKLPAYMATFDQTTTPWTINIVAVSDTPVSECRLSRNISTLTVETDHSELCTRLYVPGLQAPLDADTISKWGVVSRGLTGDEGLTADELTAYGTRYLEEHKNPALTVSIDAFDLHKATGEQMDAFRLGYVCRVCLPDYGQTINQRIVTLSWPDLVADAENVRLTLASRAETAADTLAGLIVDTTVQRRLIYKNGQELDRLVVRTIANEEQITIITPRLDILSLDIQALADRITLQANDILTLSAGVEENRAAIVLADGRIEAQANEIALKADKIELEGLVKATELEAVRADITNLTAGVTTAATLKAGVLNAGTTLIVGGEIMGKRQITMGDVVTVGKALSTDSMDLQHSHAVSVNSSGKLQLGGVTTEGNGGNFNIADTQFYKDGVSAAINSVTVYSPFVDRVEHPGANSKLMRVYMQAEASNGATSDIASELISAAPVYDVGYNAGFAASESQYTAGTYYKGNGSVVYARGDSVTPTARTLYVAPTGGATAVTVYDVGSSSTLYKGNGGSWVSRGEAITAYIKA